MSVSDKHLVLLTLLQRNFTTMGMLQLLLQALRAPHSILEAAQQPLQQRALPLKRRRRGTRRCTSPSLRRFASAAPPPPSAAGYRALSQEWM